MGNKNSTNVSAIIVLIVAAQEIFAADSTLLDMGGISLISVVQLLTSEFVHTCIFFRFLFIGHQSI